MSDAACYAKAFVVSQELGVLRHTATPHPVAHYFELPYLGRFLGAAPWQRNATTAALTQFNLGVLSIPKRWRETTLVEDFLGCC